MPASEFAWPGAPAKGPIFQVYGTKRKAANEAVAQNTPGAQDIQQAKRVCTWQHPESQGAMSAVEEVNHNSMTMADLQQQLAQQQQQQHQQQIQQQMLQQHLLAQQQQQQQQAHMQDDHIMDLCDETFSSHRVEDVSGVESAMMSMDSDCAPDPNQYLPRPTSNTTDTDTEYCRNYCGTGDESPTSGRVRCYCKPSWEGMMHLRPYVSDIY